MAPYLFRRATRLMATSLLLHSRSTACRTTPWTPSPILCNNSYLLAEHSSSMATPHPVGRSIESPLGIEWICCWSPVSWYLFRPSTLFNDHQSCRETNDRRPGGSRAIIWPAVFLVVPAASRLGPADEWPEIINSLLYTVTTDVVLFFPLPLFNSLDHQPTDSRELSQFTRTTL